MTFTNLRKIKIKKEEMGRAEGNQNYVFFSHPATQNLPF